jgi:SAM-dependent methyltransferase
MAEAKNYNAFLEKLVLKYAPQDGGLILDIGAGIGTFAKGISDKSYRVHCVEPDLEQSKEIVRIGLTVDTSIDNIPNDSVDFIYSLNVLEHIENDKEALKLWTRKLKLGGTILIYVPAFNVLYSSFDKLLGHYRRYSKNLLVEVAIASDLRIEKVKYFDSMGFFVSLPYKWINNGEGKISKKTLVFYDKYLFPVRYLFDFFFFNTLGKNVYIVGKRV